jgi:hypothetical protein
MIPSAEPLKLFESHLALRGSSPANPGIPARFNERVTKFERLFAANSPDQSFAKTAAQLANRIRRITKIRHDRAHGLVNLSFDDPPVVEIIPSKHQRIRRELAYKIPLEELERKVANELAGFPGEVTGLLRPFHPVAWRRYWPPPIGTKGQPEPA